MSHMWPTRFNVTFVRQDMLQKAEPIDPIVNIARPNQNTMATSFLSTIRRVVSSIDLQGSLEINLVHHQPHRWKLAAVLTRPGHALQSTLSFVAVVLDRCALDTYISGRSSRLIGLAHLGPLPITLLDNFSHRPVLTIIAAFLQDLLDDHLRREVNADLEDLKLAMLRIRPRLSCRKS